MTNKFIKTFKLLSHQDLSGCSGTGVVACGCIFEDTGECILHWFGSRSSNNFYHSVDDLISLHGHGTMSEIIWDEEEIEKDSNGEKK